MVILGYNPPGGVNIGKGEATPTIPAGTTETHTIVISPAMPTADHAAMVSIVDGQADCEVLQITSQTTTRVVVRVRNNDGLNAVTPTIRVRCFA